MKATSLASLALVSALALWSAPARADIVLLSENFTNAGTLSPVWSSSDGGFEVYDINGASARGMSTTFDDDNNPLTSQVNIPGGIEVNNNGTNVVLTASFTLPTGADVGGALSFFAGLRGTPVGAQTVEVYDFTTSTSLTGPLAITMASPPSEWNFNTFGVDFTSAGVGDTIQVLFRATGSSAEGLELAVVNFTAVPEPSSVAMLTLLGVAGAGWCYRRRRQSTAAASVATTQIEVA